jgi:hypothetical protein
VTRASQAPERRRAAQTISASPVAAVLAAIAPVFAPVGAVFTTIADVLAPIEAIFHAVADAGVRPAIADVLAPVSLVLAAIADVLTSIPHVFTSIPHVLDAFADPRLSRCRRYRCLRHQREQCDAGYHGQGSRSLTCEP